MSHGIFCFCSRCLYGGTSKKGGNRGHRNGKPKPEPKPSGNFNKSRDHHDSLKGGGGNNGGKRRWHSDLAMSINWPIFIYNSSMFGFSFYKKSQDIQTAHVYEHMVVQKIRAYFRTKNLICNIDYTISGVTRDSSGILEIDIQVREAYVKAFTNYAKLLATPPDKNGKNVTNALMQVIAEEDTVLEINKNQLIQSLNELDSIPWSTQIFDICHPLDTHYSSNAIFDTGKPSKNSSFNVEIYLPNGKTKNSEKDTVVFNDIARILAVNIGNNIADEDAFYFYSLSVLGNTCTLNFRHDIGIVYNPNGVQAQLDTELDKIRESNFDKKLLSDVKGLDESDEPDFDRIFHETGVVCTLSEWKQLYTQLRVNRILEKLIIRALPET